MMNSNMRMYDYFTFGDLNGYGQPQLSPDPIGQVKMAIYLTSQSVQGNINYSDAQYVGLTHDLVEDDFVIQYGKERLKVLYVNSQGRVNQVFMVKM